MNRVLRSPVQKIVLNVRYTSQKTAPVQSIATHFDDFISFPIDEMKESKKDFAPEPVSVPSPINFNDPRASFKSKTLFELIRGALVFTACQYKPLVNNSETLIKLSYRILGLNLTNKVLKLSFFGHFCAGEDEASITPTIHRLRDGGVGSILDYAAESDVVEEDEKIVEPESPMVKIPESTTVQKVKGRVYDYKNEEMCDVHFRTFENAIRSVYNVSPTGFAAIKCTALGNPELLKRASTTLIEIRNLFHRLDKKGTGFVSKEDFLEVFSTKIEGKDVLTYFDVWDADRDGQIDYIEWTNAIKLEELHLLTAHCTVQGPLFNSTLDEEERELLKNMKARIFALGQLAKDLGVRLMIDAEHNYFQPAIDHITNELKVAFNKTGSFPAIFSTYQMYLKDSRQRLITDLDRARKGNYKFAAKLVRGAYMVLERQYANENQLPDPLLDNIQMTHDNYNFAVREAISRIARGDDVEIMIASHNQKSVELAVAAMDEFHLPPNSGVYFGQLLGMSDHLTFSLGGNGYKAYKYVPYGKVNEVMPYLIRRAQENSDALGGAKAELKMINQEILRRIGLRA